ncbi:MAG: alpha-galactosidase [Clostridia bacterium]|nr:alpha-galactosidase [Clostridia bacterium]
MKTAVKRADMCLMEKIFLHSDTDAKFEAIPLTWKLGGREMTGIPAKMKRKYTREIVDANLTRHTYTGHCGTCGLTLTVIHNEYRDYPVSEWVAYFTNDGDADTEILSDVMLGGVIPGSFKAFVHGNGDNCNDTGYEWWTDTLDEPMEIHPNDGTSCNGAFPYMRLDFEGFVVRAAVGWPHIWKADIARTEDGVKYTCGQMRCNMKIHPGETMRTPMLTMMISEGDETRSMNLWRRWYMDHIIPREFGKPLEPIMCLHHHGCEGKPEHTAATEENQILGLREYRRQGLNPDIWWIDAGWYKCDYNWPHTGTWKPDADRLPNGFGPIGEECDREGTRLLVWFEPERVVPGTELYDEHYDWLLPSRDDRSGNHLLNLGDKEACDWLIERVDSIIKQGKIRVYRQDFNFDPKSCWVKAEEEDRIGAMENLHVQGYLRYWDTLIERNPGLWCDSCASGGRRNDLETMRRSVPLHYTDVGYGEHVIKQKQFRELHEWIPYFRSHNMSWDREFVEKTLGQQWAENDDFSFQCAMVPAVTYITWYNAPEDQFERTIRWEKVWRRAAKYTLDGDYYPLSECRKNPADWYAVQFDDDGEGFIQFIRNREAAEETFTVYPTVIDGAVYEFTDSTTGAAFTKTADELKNGFAYPLPVRSGVVLFYKAK